MVANSVTSVVDNINSATSKTTDAASAKSQANYQDFLHLLTTQLQNQDPTAPADTNQLTQQIATLSQVEQQINTNQNLTKLIGLFNNTNINSVVSYIGKQVETDGNKGLLQNGKASFVYTLPSEAKSATVQILDSTGKVVLSSNGTTASGRNEVYWDGVDSDGKQLADNAYTIKVTAKDMDGADMKVTTQTVGVVTSVDMVGGVATVMLGDVPVTIDKINSVRPATVIAQTPTTPDTTPKSDTAT